MNFPKIVLLSDYRAIAYRIIGTIALERLPALIARQPIYSLKVDLPRLDDAYLTWQDAT